VQGEEKVVKLNCVLQGDVAHKFLAIKGKKGLTNNTEVIRLLISEFFAISGKKG